MSYGASAWDSATDEAVLLGVARRDEQALGVLYDRYGGRALGLALRILRDRGAAEDVVQESFLSIWRRAVSYDTSRGSAQRWLLTIVHNRAIDRVRSKAGRAEQDDTPLDDVDRVLTVDDPWHEVEDLLRRDELRRWLANLRDTLRRTLELAYFDGYRQRDIGGMMAVPVGTVKARTRTALPRVPELAETEPDAQAPPVPIGESTARGAP